MEEVDAAEALRNTADGMQDDEQVQTRSDSFDDPQDQPVDRAPLPMGPVLNAIGSGSGFATWVRGAA